MLRKLIDLICPAIAAYDPILYGFSRGKVRQDGYETEVIRLCIPLWYWKGESYCSSRDQMRTGWWLQVLVLGVMKVAGGFDIRFRTGALARSGTIWHQAQ